MRGDFGKICLVNYGLISNLSLRPGFSIRSCKKNPPPNYSFQGCPFKKSFKIRSNFHPGHLAQPLLTKEQSFSFHKEGLRNTKVLIVDDDYLLAHLIQLMLEDEGYEARAAGDGRDS